MGKTKVFNVGNITVVYEKKKKDEESSITYGFTTGSKTDGKYVGLNHLFEHLLFRCKSLNETLELSDKQKDCFIPSTLGAYTSRDSVVVDGHFEDEDFEKVLDIVTYMYTKNDFTPEAIKEELKIVLREVAMYLGSDRNDIAEMCYWQLLAEVKSTKGFDILGNEKTLNTITPKVLEEYVKKYINQDNLVISVKTELPITQVKDEVEKLVASKIQPASSKKYIIPISNEEKYSKISISNIVKTNERQDSKLYFIFRHAENESLEKRYAKYIMLENLMNGIDSSLFKETRFFNQLCYECGHFNQVNMDEDFSVFHINIAPNELENTQKAMCEILKKIKSEGFDKSSFEKMKFYILKNKFEEKTTANSNFNLYIYDKKGLNMKKVKEEIEELDVKTLNKTFEKIISEGQLSFVAYGGNLKKNHCLDLQEMNVILDNKAKDMEVIDTEDPNIQEIPYEEYQKFEEIKGLTLFNDSYNDEEEDSKVEKPDENKVTEKFIIDEDGEICVATGIKIDLKEFEGKTPEEQSAIIEKACIEQGMVEDLEPTDEELEEIEKAEEINYDNLTDEELKEIENAEKEMQPPTKLIINDDGEICLGTGIMVDLKELEGKTPEEQTQILKDLICPKENGNESAVDMSGDDIELE